MVDLLCELDWASGCPDIWPNIPGVSVRVFRTRGTFELKDRVKQIALPNASGPRPVSLRATVSGAKRLRERELGLPDC